MAVFNVAFLNPKNKKASGGSGYGILTDQLSILENDLKGDGNLSPGDYDLLINKAQVLSTHPGLTADQRSALNVKISAFNAAKKVNDYTKDSDITRMNDVLRNEQATDMMMVGSDPEKFLAGRLESLKVKANDLNAIIERRSENGDDVFQYQNELQSTMAEYNSKYQALSAMANFDPANPNPIPGYVAYVKTNNQGEITDVSYEKFGDKSGFTETNAMINGFQVYGKVNNKSDGKNVFILGQNRFSAPDSIFPDPMNPGSTKSQKLIDEDTINNAKLGAGDFVKASAIAGYKNFDATQLQTQSYIPRNSFAKDSKGIIYKRKEDGSYAKYINVKSNGLGGMPNPDDMITLPKEYISNIAPSINESVDMSDPAFPNSWDPNSTTGMSFSPEVAAQNKIDSVFSPISPLSPPPSQGNPSETTPSSSAPTLPESGASSSVPIKRTPQKPAPSSQPGFMQIASKTIGSAIQAIKNKF